MKVHFSQFFMKTCLAICLFLTSCAANVDNSKMIGLWIEYPCQSPQEMDCASIELFTNGTFVIKNAPEKYFPYANGDGTWVLITKRDILANQELHLRFNPEPQLGMQMWISTLDNPVVIFTWFNDESDAIYFAKDK